MRTITDYRNLSGRGKTDPKELRRVQGMDPRDMTGQVVGLNSQECKVEGVADPNVPVQGVNHGAIKVKGPGL